MKGTKRIRAIAVTAVTAGALTGAIAASASAATTPSRAVAPSAKATAATPASPGRYCGTYGDGYTAETTWYKKPPGCYDFNLTWAKWSGYYRGYLWNGSRWEACSRWVHHTGGETYLQVLCSSVKTGVPMEVGHVNSSGGLTANQGIHIHVNY